MRCAYAIAVCVVFLLLRQTDCSKRVIRRPHRLPRSKHSGPKMTEVKANFPEVNYEEVKEVLNVDGAKGVVIDVRHPKELEEDGRVPGFINIPLNDVKMAFAMKPKEFKLTYHVSKPDPEKDVIFSCRSGRRALMAAEKLQEENTYPNIKVYAGSFQDWVKNGGPFIQGPLQGATTKAAGDQKKEENVKEKKEGGKQSQENEEEESGIRTDPHTIQE